MAGWTGSGDHSHSTGRDGDAAAVALADPAVDHVPGVLGVPQHGVHGLGGPAFPGGGGVAGRVGVQPGGDGGHAELVHGPPGEDLRHDRGAVGVAGEPGLGAALAGLDRDRVRDAVREVPVGGGADVPPVQGVLDEAFPGFLLQLEPEPFRDALLHPPDQDGGGIDAVDDGGLVGGEQRDPVAGQFLFQFQRVEGVAAGAFDVLADDRGEFRGRAGGFGEQVGHAAVAGDPGAGEGPPGLALAAGFQVQAAGFDVPVVGGDEPAWGQPGAGGADLPAQRGDRGPASPGWRCGPGTRPGPARPGRAPCRWPRRRPASWAWCLLALPLEYLHDCLRLARVYFLGAFPGGDADLEPDLDPARPFPPRSHYS